MRLVDGTGGTILPSLLNWSLCPQDRPYVSTPFPDKTLFRVPIISAWILFLTLDQPRSTEQAEKESQKLTSNHRGPCSYHPWIRHCPPFRLTSHHHPPKPPSF